MSDINDFVIENGALKKYKGSGGDVVIPEGVTSIGRCAFYICSSLASVVIPEGVTSIGERAFYDCSSLTNVLIPEGVTSIGIMAFSGCSSLASVVIPEGVTSIGIMAFFGCRSLANVVIPKSVTSIGNSTFGYCSSLTNVVIPESVKSIGWDAFEFCSSLTNVMIPEGVTSIGKRAFLGCRSLVGVTLPKSLKSLGDSAFDSRCSWALPGSQLAKMSISVKEVFSVIDSSVFNNEDIADLYLNKRSNEWRHWLREKYVAAEPQKVFGYIYETFATAKKVNKTEALLMSEFIEKYSPKLSSQDVRKMMALLEEKKCPVLEQLRGIPQIESHLTEGKQPVQEHPVEAFVRERIEKLNPDPRILSSIKKGVHFKEPKTLCSSNVLAFIISRYAKQMRFDNNGKPDLISGNWLSFDQEADYVAAALDRKELSDMLTRLVKGSYGLYLLSWARYALDDRISELMAGHISMSRGKAKLDSKGYNFYEALMLSDTLEAMQMFDKYGDLDRYAHMRRKTAMEMRDSLMLPAFDFDADGIKRYDIGGNIIEVSIAPDLSFRLFDTNKQKVIRSFPKKSDDPAKAEACAKEYAAFKKEVLAFAKARSELLHRMHMSGEWLNPDLWQKVYIEHPVIRHLAQLVVWQDEASKTFMIADGATVDVQGNAYAPQGKIRVAHTLDMNAADVAAWQQWLAKRGCVQLFEQVWEPVIQWDKNGIMTRYNGAMLTDKERNAVKKALKLRGVDMRAAEWDVMFERDWDRNRTYFVGYGSKNDMLFGDSLKIVYMVNDDTKVTTFAETSICSASKPREINAILLEMDKATLSAQITHDNDAALTDRALSAFSAAQITGLLNLAIDHKATRCTARLLDYKNVHFPEFAEVNEFSLDW